MSHFPLPSLLVMALLAAPALANDTTPLSDEEKASPWSGRGELGFASARGNSSTESFNGRLNVQYSEDQWVHGMDLFGIRSSAEYLGTDGQTTRRTTSNRYTVGANSALQLEEHRQVTGAMRYEQDDFGKYSWLQTASLGYGSRVLDGDRTRLDLQIGPGFRRAHDPIDNETESGPIARGFIGLKYALTENTELANTLLVESGSHNTYAQNDLGVSVAMNSHLALKAGLQARHNTDVDDDRKKTDTLTTMNVVYRFK